MEVALTFILVKAKIINVKDTTLDLYFAVKIIGDLYKRNYVWTVHKRFSHADAILP